MFDAAKLLGTMLEHRSAPSAGDRLGNALGRGGSTGVGGGSPLGELERGEQRRDVHRAGIGVWEPSAHAHRGAWQTVRLPCSEPEGGP